ncbi:MAG: helix-turn-helix transcriptional regulator [Bryobacteraceae bacterium]
MSRQKLQKRRANATVGQAILALRKDLHETTTEFGLRLGVHNATISCYERDKLSPSPGVLLKLLYLATKAGRHAEREVFSVELKQCMDVGLIGGRGQGTGDDQQVLDGLASLAPEFNIGDVLMQLLGKKRQTLGFRQFAVAVAHLMVASDAVDESVAEILQLWVAHSGRPATTGHFRDALGFLRASLWRERSQDRAQTGEVSGLQDEPTEGDPSAG